MDSHYLRFFYKKIVTDGIAFARIAELCDFLGSDYQDDQERFRGKKNGK